MSRVPVKVAKTIVTVLIHIEHSRTHNHRCLPLLCILFTAPPRLLSSDLPDTEASEEGLREAHEIKKLTRKWLADTEQSRIERVRTKRWKQVPLYGLEWK